MKRLGQWALIGATGLLIAAAGSQELDYPEGFRTWRDVHSGVIAPPSQFFPRFGGLHTIYANELAMKGYAGGPFPDGSVIVFDVFDTTAGPHFEPIKRKQVDMMVKKDGRWRFTEFAGDSRTERSVPVDQAETQCAVCHAKAKHDSVYSYVES